MRVENRKDLLRVLFVSASEGGLELEGWSVLDDCSHSAFFDRTAELAAIHVALPRYQPFSRVGARIFTNWLNESTTNHFLDFHLSECQN